MNRILAIVMAVLLWGQMAARDNTPDFNFPKDVTAQAQADLSKALAQDDGRLVVDALVRSSLARSSVSIENMTAIIEDIDRVARREKRSDIRALLHHLEAEVLDSYRYYFTPYERRNSPHTQSTQVKDKYALWDSEEFGKAIDSLITLSVSDRETLLQKSVKDYGDLITYNSQGAKYLPTLYHFLSYRGAEMASTSLGKQLYANLEEAAPGDLTATMFARCKSVMAHANSSEKEAKCLQLYKRYANHEESGLPLSMLDANDDYYAEFKQYVKRHPRSIHANKIRDNITHIERKEARVDYPGHLNSNVSKAGKNASVQVKIKVRNVNDLSVRVYRVPDNLIEEVTVKTEDLRLILTRDVKLAGTVPFDATGEITLPPLPYGKYVIAPCYRSKDGEMLPVTVSQGDMLSIYDLAAFTVSESPIHPSGGTPVNRFIVVDDATGRPVQDATVTLSRLELTTDKNGYADIPGIPDISYEDGYNSAEYRVSKGGDKYSPKSRFSRNSNYVATVNTATVLTDLGIYRPGETMKWAGIIYSLSDDSRDVLAGREVHITIYDANHKAIDRQTATTDCYGRVEGSYTIPTGRLLGRYSIHIGLEEKGSLGSSGFQVSEYKTPTFYVEFPRNDLAFEPGKPITVTGKAATYSGIPLADAEVKLKLTKRRWSWRWWCLRPASGGNAVADTVVRTDANGQFRVTFPNELFYESSVGQGRYCYYYYTAHAQVTDATGESQEASAGLHIGHKREVSIGQDVIRHNNVKPLRLPVTYSTTDTARQTAAFAYWIASVKGNTDTIRGTLSSDNPVMDLTAMPSGRYDIRVMLADEPDNYSTGTIYLYRMSDDKAPVENRPLWIPREDCYIDNNNVAHVIIGTSTSEAHIYYVASGRSQMLGNGWIDFDKSGFKEFTFKVPAKPDEQLRITFMAFHHGQYFEQKIALAVPACEQTLQVKATSFRDKLIPGKPERWTLTLTDKHGRPQQGAMVLEMYDKASNALSDNTWKFSPNYRATVPVTTWHSGLLTDRRLYRDWSANEFVLARMDYRIPELNLYGRRMWQGCDNPFYASHRLAGRVLKEEVVVAKGYQNVDKRLSTNDEDADGEQPSIDTKKMERVAMRMSDVKTVLWRPMLTSDAQGNVSLEFDAPNFNTTWIVQAVAYNAGLASGAFNAEVLTQKPIMVKSSLPRFVRQGDVTRLSANLQNSSDHAIRTEALIEVFDPRTNRVYASQAFNETVGPMASKPLMMAWTVPDTIPFVGFRVRAVGDDFGDGEQVMLPVLAAVSPVIEAIPFFLDAYNGHSMSGQVFTLPQMPENARVTLEYCDNPLWQCVTALPSIFSDNDQIATSIAHSLYALNVTRGVATGQPIIAEAFRYWQENAQDSMLVSALERNADLKISNLVASPWLSTAERQTLQMKQLADFFDAEKAREKHDQLVQALANLQMPDGGFAWCKYPDCKSSRWTTGTVLAILGDVRQLGYLPTDDRLDRMLTHALDYYDKQYVAEAQKKENKNAIYSAYAYTRSLYDDVPMSKEAGKLYRNIVDKIARQWDKRDLSLSSKAFCAMTLEYAGKHKEALRLIESLRQYALTDSTIGMYWDQFRNRRWFLPSQMAVTSTILRAMNAVDPRADELDQVRKWMLLSKRTTDWGGSSLAADAVQALLSSGIRWLDRGMAPAVAVDGRLAEFDKFDSFVGYSRMDIDARAGSEIVINRNSNGSPAWGALYIQYTRPMHQVQAAAIDEVSITKEFVPLDAAERPVTDGRAIAVGDKVRVRLIIECNQAMDYVTITDERASCFEPADKTSGYRYQERLGYYRETRDSATNLFIGHLPKGTHVVTYDVYATTPGTFASGIATLQSQQAPEMSAHTAGQTLSVMP